MVKSVSVRKHQSVFSIVRHTLRLLTFLLLISLLLSTSSVSFNDPTEKARSFTRYVEFDYLSWTLTALQTKLVQYSWGIENYLASDTRRQTVLDYLELVATIQNTEAEESQFYTNPDILNPELASAPLQRKKEQLETQRQRIAPLVEAILQEQINHTAFTLGLSLGGQAVPPVLFHSTDLPLALIISPRELIRLDENISLQPDLSLDERELLEERVDQSLNVSSLVVDVGGVGTYPTMVDQSPSLVWLSEVVAHEWVHNYLTLRPLGMLYLSEPEMRVINETVASIAGKEIGRAMLERYYPELVPPPPPPPSPEPPPSEPPAFDYRAEMHLTRITADDLLAQGKIEEAEAYMEMRRSVFWDHGYRHLRKLNQAYFAFHGAYADEPGGASGETEDPIGAAVRVLRAQSPSLAAFLNRVSWLTSFEQLLQLVSQLND